MAKYVGMPLKEVYSFACEEYHLKRNSRFYNELPADPNAVDSVREIDVSRNYIGARGLRALLEVVRCCSSLHTLILRDQQLVKESVLLLCDALVSHPSLRKLDLRQNPITIDGGRHLFDLVSTNSRIEQVLLENTEVKESLITAINTRTDRNASHRMRLEAIAGSRTAAGGGAAAAATHQPATADAASTNSAATAAGATAGGGGGQNQQQQQQASSDEAGSDFYSGSSSGGDASSIASRIARSADATLDASLAREIIQRCPISVSSRLLDEDIHAALSERCEATRCHFLDPDFAPNVEAISSVSSELPAQVKSWRRIVSFENACVFSDTAAPREPVNVSLDFAWIFTSMFSVLHGSELQQNLQALVSPPHINPAGVYCVKFFIDGKWRCVVVDDYIPVASSSAGGVTTPAFCGPDAKNAFWPVIILKAAAKLHGSYRALQSTLVAHPNRHPTLELPITAATVMSDFSGGVGVSRQLNHAQFDSTAWFQTMMELHEQKAWLVATSGADNEATSNGGIMPHHAYRIRQIRSVNGNKLVQLQSIHSKRVWIGEWGHSSPLWELNLDVMTALAYRPSSTRGPASPFWMRYSSFLQCFHTVHACCPCMQSFSSMVEGAWVKSTAGGPAFEPTTWWCNPHYRLRLPQPTKVLIALSVPDARFHSSSVSAMGLHLLRGDDYPLRCEKDLLYATTNYAVSNCVTYSAELPEGVLWVVPSAYEEGVHGRFFLRVVSSECFSFAHENRDDHMKTYQIQCNLADSGEYQHGESNPQFVIETMPDNQQYKTNNMMMSAVGAGATGGGSGGASQQVQSNNNNNNVDAVGRPFTSSLTTGVGAAPPGMCRIAVQMHAAADNLNVGLILCTAPANEYRGSLLSDGSSSNQQNMMRRALPPPPSQPSSSYRDANNNNNRMTEGGEDDDDERNSDAERQQQNDGATTTTTMMVAAADRLLGPISDERIVARSKLIIGRTVHLDAHVPISQTPYILVPCVLPQHSANVPLQLTVWCSAARCAISEIPFWPCMELGVEWTRSGGLQDVAQNPQIELVVRRPQQRFLLNLEVFGVQDPSLILYVVKQARGHESIALPPGHRVPDSAIVCNSQFVRHHTTTCEFDFVAPTEPGSLPARFIVLPCLQPPGTSARGTLSVSSEWEDFDVSLLPVNTHDA